MVDRTLILVKCTAVRDALPILTMACDAGLRIAKLQHQFWTREKAEAFYAEHMGRPYAKGLIDSVTGGAGVVAAVLEGEHAIQAWRGLLGPTDPAKARIEAPDSVRGRFGRELPDNAAHGSDKRESYLRELAIVFPDELGRLGS